MSSQPDEGERKAEAGRAISAVVEPGERSGDKLSFETMDTSLI
jgi:hypothetical protein